MSADFAEEDSVLDPEDVNSAPLSGAGAEADGESIPVPPAMSAAEIDERAKVVESLRTEGSAGPRTGESSGDPAGQRSPRGRVGGEGEGFTA